MLKKFHTHYHISKMMNAVISGVHVDAWDPLAISCSRARRDKAGPVCTGILSYM